MPRIERGSVLIDVSVALRLDEEHQDRILDTAARQGGVLVTAPSIVPAWVGGRALKVALGVGSIILPPGALGEKPRGAMEASAPAWVDGCRPGPVGSRVIVIVENGGRGGGAEPVLRGPIEPWEIRDPLVLGIAGQEAEALPLPRAGGLVGLAGVKGEPVIVYAGGETRVSVVGGQVKPLLNYLAKALGRCPGP